jgi:hypothetical protein
MERGPPKAIAVVGHADLAPWTLALLEGELRARLARCAEAGRTGLVRVGQGLPVAFGRAAKQAGLALVAGELLLLSQRVRLLEYDPADRDVCVRVDERLLRACARVVAIWDGTASNGRDTTAHLVAYARSHGIDVEVLWPGGAERVPGFGEESS